MKNKIIKIFDKYNFGDELGKPIVAEKIAELYGYDAPKNELTVAIEELTRVLRKIYEK